MLKNFRKSFTFAMLPLIASLLVEPRMDAQLSPTLAVGGNHDGTLEVFLIKDTPEGIYTDSRQTVPNGSWSSSNFSGVPDLIQLALTQHFRLPPHAYGQNQTSKWGYPDLFGVDGRGNVWNRVPDDGGYAFKLLGTFHNIADIATGQNEDGSLEVFGTDYSGTLWHIRQAAAFSPDWSDWSTLGSGKKVGNIAVGQNLDGRLEIFAIDNHGTLLHLHQYQTAPGGGYLWTDWGTLGEGHSKHLAIRAR